MILFGRRSAAKAISARGIRIRAGLLVDQAPAVGAIWPALPREILSGRSFLEHERPDARSANTAAIRRRRHDLENSLGHPCLIRSSDSWDDGTWGRSKLIRPTGSSRLSTFPDQIERCMIRNRTAASAASVAMLQSGVPLSLGLALCGSSGENVGRFRSDGSPPAACRREHQAPAGRFPIGGSPWPPPSR